MSRQCAERRRRVKLDFERNTQRAVAAAFVNKILGIVMPFLSRTLFLWLLGVEYLGLNGLFASILGVLALADLGFGTAVVCSMYKPVADDDRELVCAYLNFYRRIYRWVGTVIFAAGLCLLPFLDGLVKGGLPPELDLHVLYLIHLVNTSVGYFLFAYRGSVLNAYHRNDVVTNMYTVTSLAQYATVFFVLFVTRNYYHYVLTTVAFTVINNLLVFRASRRLFPSIEPRGELPETMRRRVMSEVKSIFMHKIGGVIAYQADNIVVSTFLGLAAVGVYGNYYYVCNAVKGLVWSVYSSIQNGFGNTVYTESKEANFGRMMKANGVVGMIIVWCAAVMLALYQPFMALWTKGAPSLSRHGLTAVLMVVFFCVNQSRQTLTTFKSAASLWRQDRWKPIVSGIVNLAMNIAFVTLLPDAYKLDGVILSTIIAFVVVEMPWEARVVFTCFFDRAQARVYWRAQAYFALAVVVTCAATWAIACAVPLRGAGGFVVKGAVSAAVAAALTSLFFRKSVSAVAEHLLGGRLRRLFVR